MMFARSAPFRAAVAFAALLLPAVASAQDPGFFVPPGGGGARPAQTQGQGQGQGQPRPPQPPRPPQAQRPQGPNPAPLPPGQPPPAAVIGIVDVPEIQRNSTAFNSVREEIERRRQRLNDDLQREQTRWREEQQNLATQRANLPAEQVRQRERELQDRITDSQRVFRDRSRGIEQAAQQALAEIEQGLAIVIRQVAASRNVNIVLPRPLVIFNEPPFDLTDEVSGQLNRVLRTVNLPAEGAAPANPPGQTNGQGAAQRPPQQPAPPAQPPQQPAQPPQQPQQPRR